MRYINEAVTKMKIRFHLAILFQILISFLAFPQQIKLVGQVSVQNSKYNTGEIQYVKNVLVTSQFSKPDYTDNIGMFTLEFVGIENGTSVKVRAEKYGYEVVNERDLQAVIIGRNSPLSIYLAKKGQLAMLQMEFYNISKRTIYAEKDAIIERLNSNKEESQKAINELNKKYEQKFKDHFEAEDFLNKKIEEQAKQLPEFAQKLATENLDFASTLYIQAYELLKKGEIENAIKVLDDNILENSYIKAKNDLAKGQKLENDANDLIEKGRLEILQTVKSLVLKAESEMLLFNFEKAIKLYRESVSLTV